MPGRLGGVLGGWHINYSLRLIIPFYVSQRANLPGLRKYSSTGPHTFQQLCNLTEVSRPSLLQRRATGVVGGIRVCASVEKQSNRLYLPMHRCEHERRAAKLISVIHSGSVVEQRCGPRDIAGSDGAEERRRAHAAGEFLRARAIDG